MTQKKLRRKRKICKAIVGGGVSDAPAVTEYEFALDQGESALPGARDVEDAVPYGAYYA